MKVFGLKGFNDFFANDLFVVVEFIVQYIFLQIWKGIIENNPTVWRKLKNKVITHTHTHTHIYIYIRGEFNMFPDFFGTGIKNCRRLLKIQYVIAIHLMRWLTNYYDFRFPETYTFGPSCRNRASILSGIRDSRKLGSLWGMMRGVGGVRTSIHQSWLAKRLGLGLLCWGFKGVQEEIPREEASTLEIGSVAFPAGQCTSLQLHPCHRQFDEEGINTVPHPPSSPDLAPCDFWLFPKLRDCRYETIEEMKEAVTKVIDTLTQEDFEGTRVSCVYYQ